MAEHPNKDYQKRLQRIEDAVQCKKPDRVPSLVDFGYYAANYAGMTIQEAYYDSDRWAQANKKIVLDMKPDVFYSLMYFSGEAFEAVDSKSFKWPGHGLTENQSYQYVEGEYMKADEYDTFLKDPSDFIIRKYLPRTAKALEPLQYLPSLRSFMGVGMGLVHPAVNFPGVIAAVQALSKAAAASGKSMIQTGMAMVKEMEDLGFPSVYQFAGVGSPFETLSNNLRGMRGCMLDMYRQPDKLLETIDRLMELSLEEVSMPPLGSNTLSFNAALRGADGFMSLEQFKKFYWPTYKLTVENSVKMGFTPIILWEGDFTSKLEFLLELPEKKVIHRFDRSDILKAKEILGGHNCISGGISSSLLKTATVQEVEDRCKWLIDNVGKDGGYIMSHSCQMDDLRPENMRAMIDVTKEYGVY